MFRLYRKPVTQAYPNVRIPRPRISKLVLFLCRILVRAYLFLFFGVAKVVVRNEAILLDAFKRALAGDSRCIIAFRHPNGGEPQLLGWFFLFKLKKFAAKRGVKFAINPHAIFVYGYEVVRWGGVIARFVMPNLGALPIHHAKMDTDGLANIYRAVAEGPYPLALSPEGQVSYTTDSVPRLEPGVVRIGFHAADRMAAKGVEKPVEILPLSVYFRFGSWGKINVEMLLRLLEKLSGFTRKSRKQLSFTERLRQCRDHILAANEARYQIKADPSHSFEERLDKVINAALETAERMLGIKSEGDLFARMYRVRQLCWDRIVLPDVDSLDGASAIERNVLALRAGEAWYIGRHQELVDFCWYFRVPLPTEATALHNRIEYIQNLWDFASRSMGGAYPNRINIFPRKMVIQAAPAINLTERLPAYHENRKDAIAQAMTDLEKAYRDNIIEANKELDLQS